MNNWQYYLLTVYANARLFLRVGIILQKYIIRTSCCSLFFQVLMCNV